MMASSLPNDEFGEEECIRFSYTLMLSYGAAKDPALVREFSSINQRYQMAPQEALSHFDPFEKHSPDIPPAFG